MSEQRSLIKSKKIIIGITFGSVAAIVGLLILLPTVINMDSIGAKIKETASQAIEGQVEFEQIRLKFLPRPHVVISKGQMAIQDSVHGKWTELSVFPSLLALLVVRLEVSDLKLIRPDFKLRLPIPSRYKSEKHVSSKGGSNLRQQIKEGLGALAAVVKNAGVEIVDGRLTVLEQDKAPLEWKKITACFDMTKKRVAVGLTCSFSFVQKIVLNAELDPINLDLNGKVTLQGLSPHQFITYWEPASDLNIADGSVDLVLRFQSQDLRNWIGEFENRTSLLKVQHNTRLAEIGPAVLKGRFNFSSSKMSLQVDQLDLDNPQLSITGKLLVCPTEPDGIHLNATGQNVNVNSVRTTALALGDIFPMSGKFLTLLKAVGFQRPTLCSRARIGGICLISNSGALKEI